MNAYTYTIRSGSVVFTFTIYADTQRNADKQATIRVDNDYPGFHITTCDVTTY